MLHAALNKSLKQHQIKQQLRNHLPPISQTDEDMQGTAGEVRTRS